MQTPIINPNVQTPSYLQIADWYRERIEEGTLVEGEMLPSTRALGKEIGVSSTPVQKALSMLQDSGYLEKASNGRYIIAKRIAPRPPTENEGTRWQVFWSYARGDDENSHGAISELMQQIRDEFALVTGDELTDFQDQKDIPWGSNWCRIIEENVQATVFFVPILTPTYLRRPNCVSEFGLALNNLKAAGIEDGIFPIVFVPIKQALSRLIDKDMRTYLESCQYIDCSGIRRLSPNESEYKKKVGEIVDQIVKMQVKLNEHQNALDSKTAGETPADDEPGLLEKVSFLERLPEEINKTASSLNSDLQIIGDKFSNATSRIEKANSSTHSVGAKIAICKQLATELEAPVSRFNNDCTAFVNYFYEFDANLNAFPAIQSFNTDESERAQAMSAFNDAISAIQTSSVPMFDGMRDFRNMAEKIHGLSRELKPALSSIKESCDLILSLEPLIASWGKESIC